MDNGKKEFPINGLEEDATSIWGRKYLCYINNCKGIKKYVKKTMNKRFRKRNKLKLRNIAQLVSAPG